MDSKTQGQRFADDPAGYCEYSYTRMQSLSGQELEALQLAALQYRFEQLYRSVPMVKKLADRQHFAGIRRIEDVLPMLFEHTMYKSYPPSLLENSRFDQLTLWLSKLTAHDLSKVDASGCKGITDWVQLLDQQTPLRISHSSGTSGTMSFNPISQSEWDMQGKTYAISVFQDFGDDPFPSADYVPNVHYVTPTYRHGANAFVRGTDMFLKSVAGSEDRVHALYPGRLDSDVLYLAARIQAAKLRGNLDSVKVSPELIARQKEFALAQARMPQDLDRFFNRIVNDLKGQRVMVMATWNMVYDLANAGLKRGIRGVFAPDSVVISGGGSKGLVRPAGWEKPVCEFTGVPRLKGAYGMSEVLAVHAMCAYDHYHLAPWAITYVLDPDTSKLLPRSGVVTGRAAFYDLSANSHWGGFITGDEITVHWDGGCPCGSRSAYLEEPITRYSDKRGGDDKISCAATPEAHREAMEFLTRIESN
jgi:hypothetical protein